MKNTFYRPEETDTEIYQEIVDKLKQDLETLVSGEVQQTEILEYIKIAIQNARPLPDKENGMLFWGLDKPSSMPSDARVMYFYTPTYITVAIMMKALLDMPEKVTRLEGFLDTLERGMLACTGRSFKGHGYDEIGGIIDSLSIFQTIDISLFLWAYPEICPKFTRLFHDYVAWLRQALTKGEILNEWGVSYSEEARTFLNSLDRKANRIVFVYGTLMKGQRNHRMFLKNSPFIGEAVLNGYSMYDLGTYPGIKEKDSDKVKGELYEVDLTTLDRLNGLEGEGSLYKLKKEPIEIGKDHLINANIYEYLQDVDENNYIPYKNQPWRGKRK